MQKMNHEVFISYANADRSVADLLVERIEKTGVRCWIAPRDEVPGLRYGDVIDEAVEQAKIVVVLFSKSALKSEWVNREVELAAALHKIIVPVRVDDVQLRGQMRLLLNNLHWIDLQADRELGVQQVSASIVRFLPKRRRKPKDLERSADSNDRQNDSDEKVSNREDPEMTSRSGSAGIKTAAAVAAGVAGTLVFPFALPLAAAAIVGSSLLDSKGQEGDDGTDSGHT